MLLFSNFALSLVTGLAASDLGPENKNVEAPVELKWKFEKDKTFYQERSIETKMVGKSMGMEEINESTKNTVYLSWTPMSQGEDKIWNVKWRIEWSNIETLTPLIGAELTVRIRPDGKVVKVNADVCVLEKLTNTKEGMVLQGLGDPGFGMLPNKVVQKGDYWSRDYEQNLGPIGKLQGTHKYIFEGDHTEEKTIAKIRVHTTAKYHPPGNGANNLKKAEVTIHDVDGTILFDREKGRLMSVESSGKLSGKFTLELDGKNTDAELLLITKMILKTTDVNPMRR